MTPRVFLTLRFFLSFLALSALAGLAAWIGGLDAAQAWPFLLAAAGLAGLGVGVRKRGRFSAEFVAPSMVFLALSVFFCLFSFRLIPMRLKDFVAGYWPLFPVAALGYLAFMLGNLCRRNRLRRDSRSEGPRRGGKGGGH